MRRWRRATTTSACRSPGSPVRRWRGRGFQCGGHGRAAARRGAPVRWTASRAAPPGRRPPRRRSRRRWRWRRRPSGSPVAASMTGATCVAGTEPAADVDLCRGSCARPCSVVVNSTPSAIRRSMSVSSNPSTSRQISRVSCPGRGAGRSGAGAMCRYGAGPDSAGSDPSNSGWVIVPVQAAGHQLRIGEHVGRRFIGAAATPARCRARPPRPACACCVHRCPVARARR